MLHIENIGRERERHFINIQYPIVVARDYNEPLASLVANRYHPVTLKWALRRLIKDGESSYEELRDVFALPSARYLRLSVSEPRSGIAPVTFKCMRCPARD